MPHEKIWDRHNRSTQPGETTQPDQHALEIGWSPNSQGDGWVQVSAQRRIDVRESALIEHSVEQVTESVISLVDRRLREAGMPHPAKNCEDIARALLPDLAYAVGKPLGELAIQLDRAGCNRAISVLRRGRNAAYGEDQ